MFVFDCCFFGVVDRQLKILLKGHDATRCQKLSKGPKTQREHIYIRRQSLTKVKHDAKAVVRYNRPSGIQIDDDLTTGKESDITYFTYFAHGRKHGYWEVVRQDRAVITFENRYHNGMFPLSRETTFREAEINRQS